MKRWLGLLAISLIGCFYPAAAQLPALVLKDINGKSVDISRLGMQGKPVILTFFATWCKPCVAELGAIRDVYSEWQAETGVELVAVSIDKAQDMAKVKPLADTEGWEYTVLLDPEGELQQALRVRGVPRVFILDGKGQIVDDHLGYGPGDEAELIQTIRQLKAD